MSKSRLVPWLGFGATLVGVAFLWHGGPSRMPIDKTPVSGEAELATDADPTRLIVDFRDDVSAETLANNGFTEIPISDYSANDRMYRIEFPNAAEAAAAFARLSHDPSVETVDYESYASISPDEETQEATAAGPGGGSMEAECGPSAPGSGFPNDACYKYQWHMRQLGMPNAWKRGNGKGVIVAVIDTGVSKVADLGETKFVDGYNFVSNNANAADDHGHGTHVAGTIAESTNNKLGVAGVAYGASIMPIKVLSARGSGSVAGITQGIRWAADHGANVINMSLGGPTKMGSMANAVKYARDKGVVIIAAAGNDGRGRVGYPAAYPGVVAVAATQFDESTTFYSNWGKEIDVAAPGGNTRVDQNGDGKPDGVLQHTIVPGNTSQTDYLWFMGTSMASPHAAGVAALIMGAGVKKPDAVEEILLGTARKPKGESATGGRVDDHYGAGIVNADAALEKAVNGRGAGELGLAGAVALLGIALTRRRGIAIERLGPGFVAALIAGSSGLFFLPGLLPQSWTHVHAVGNVLSSGVTDAVSGAIGPNPLALSAVLPLALTVLLYGVRKLRPALAGFGFGVAGALLFAAIAGTVDVRWMPNVLDPIWLAVHAAVAGVLASAVLRKA
ncbi:MAG TPA: S8 family serine peptidase [Polyangia bacterium]|nr:S8 family serine peptidase [Polyangia bacterium]